MTEIPQRSTLVAQTAGILRRSIEQGEWVGHLPGERALCERFQVSRITVRAALEVLRRDGWIEGSKGRRNRIVPGRNSRAPIRQSRVIALLAGMPYHSLSAFSLYLISELQGHLHNAGYRFEVHAHSRFGGRHWSDELKAILAQVRADVWIVLGGFQEGERWLSEHRVRAIVVGSGTERISLPCLGTDYQSACRHAVGVLRSKGHDRIALLLPESKGPESSPYVDGFLEGFTGSTQREDARSRVQFHDGTVRGVCSVLRNLFRSAPPSALLVARPKHALNAMTYLHDAGLHVPRDVSIIALGYEPYLDNVIPPITHYEIAWPSFAKRLFRMVMRLATTGNLPGHPVLVMPEFRKGETVLAKS